MQKFQKSLPAPLREALERLANPGGPANWWKEVLASEDLFLAVRDGYLNAYADGQSIFKIGREAGTGLDREGDPVVMIHYKYLLEPSRPGRGNNYVRFNGKSFCVEPRELVCTTYEPGKTLPRLISAASQYAGKEKIGVHVIAAKNPTVIDLEIAFTESSEDGDDSKGLRIDLAALHPAENGQATLVFYEAKRADDSRLHSDSKEPEVIQQIKSYDTFLKGHAEELVEAYREVCSILIRLRSVTRSRPIPPIVEEVADGRRKLTIDEKAQLLVFGFDQTTKDGKLFRRRMRELKEMLGPRVIAKGGAASFDLLKDYIRFRSSSRADFVKSVSLLRSNLGDASQKHGAGVEEPSTGL
jgi:hypothetical protein